MSIVNTPTAVLAEAFATLVLAIVEAAGTQADRLETPTPGGDPHHHGSDEDEGGRAQRP